MKPAFVKIGCFCLLVLTGCNPIFVVRGAIEEANILYNAVPIEEALARNEYSNEEKEKLRIVQDARTYSRGLNLKPDGSFSSYSKLNRDVLAWVLVASKMDSFSLYTWWYPVVGSVPYKGYFNKKAALCAAEGLAGDGYEVSIRPTDAISTLGWFDDPILSTTLQHSSIEIANTVLHEIFHQTIWIPDHVPFNESAAHFFATMSTPAFFELKLSACEDEVCRQEFSKHLSEAKSRINFEFEFSDIVLALYEELDALYKNKGLSREEKLVRREAVFQKHISPLLTKYPKMRALREVNNSEIIQLKIYLTGLRQFETLLKRCSGDFDCFMESMQHIKDRRSEEDPFEALQDLIEKHTAVGL